MDAVEPQIRLLLAEFPDMPATVIAERIGWDRSLTVLEERVRELRPVDPASRTSYGPGEWAQCDLWFPQVAVPLGFGQAARLRMHQPFSCGYPTRAADLACLGARPR